MPAKNPRLKSRGFFICVYQFAKNQGNEAIMGAADEEAA